MCLRLEGLDLLGRPESLLLVGIIESIDQCIDASRQVDWVEDPGGSPQDLSHFSPFLRRPFGRRRR